MTKRLLSSLFGLFATAGLNSSFATDVSEPVSGTWTPAGNPLHSFALVSDRFLKYIR